MKLVDGNNMLHREAEKIGRGVHPVRFIYSRFIAPPEPTIIVWDGPYANERRKKIYPPYKANRRPKEESKYKFFEIAKGVLNFSPVIQVECKGWEADDIIGTLVNEYHTKHDLTVETNDGDYWQHSDKCFLPLVSKKWHVFTPDECLLYKSLVGDTKDGIPGIPGFGLKSWERLSEASRRRLILGIKTNDLTQFMNCDEWPVRVKPTKDVFDSLCLYFKLNSYWKVPMSEIEAGMKQGKLNIAAAEIFMGKFLI